MKNHVACVCLVLAIGGVGFLTRSQAQPAAAPAADPAASADPESGGTTGPRPFGDKVLFVYLKAEENTMLLAGPEIRTAGGEAFLTGVPLQMPKGSWTEGRRHWVALDTVASIIEFDSEADFAKRIKEGQAAERGAGGGGDAADDAPPRNPGRDLGGL